MKSFLTLCQDAIFTQIQIETLSEHLSRKQKHARHADREERSVFEEVFDDRPRFSLRTLAADVCRDNPLLVELEREHEHDKADE